MTPHPAAATPTAEQVQAILDWFEANVLEGHDWIGTVSERDGADESRAARQKWRVLRAALAPAERSSPVKHLNATGQFYERVKAWWLARGTSEFRGATIGGNGYINIFWEDATETGAYSVRIDDLYQVPAERAEAVPGDIIDDLTTHRRSWLNAFNGMIVIAERSSIEDGADLSYWQHEKATFLRALDALSARFSAPTRAVALDAAGASGWEEYETRAAERRAMQEAANAEAATKGQEISILATTRADAAEARVRELKSALQGIKARSFTTHPHRISADLTAEIYAMAEAALAAGDGGAEK